MRCDVCGVFVGYKMKGLKEHYKQKHPEKLKEEVKKNG